jgi:chromosome partitioning protein
VAKILETVQLVSRRMNPRLKVSGILLTMFDSQTKLSNEVVVELKRFIDQAQGQDLPWSKARVFATKIRRNIKLAESPSFGQHILKYEPTSNGAIDYRALAKEVVAMTEGPAEAPMARPPVKVNVATNIDPAKLIAASVGNQNQEVA